MGRNVGIQQCEGMTVSGGRQEKGFLNAILFAFSVRGREGLWKRLWLTTSNRIGVIRFCFGMRVTGSRFASTTMTWRQWPRTGIRNINIDCVSYTRVGVLNLHNPVQDWPPPPQTWIFAELSRGDSPAVWYFSQNVFKCKGNPSESFDKKYRKTVFLMGKNLLNFWLSFHKLVNADISCILGLYRYFLFGRYLA